MKVPFVDLIAQYVSIRDGIEVALTKVLESASFIGGEEVRSFEEEFADYIGVRHCVGCANGTDAIELCLTALGIGPGDEVITPSHTFVAAVEAIASVGARPIFVDIDEDTMLVDPASIERAVTHRTKALLPVHLYGQPCDLDALSDIAERHGLFLIEDAAQAHGARWAGKRAGSFGHVATFSFYPGKNLGAYGDAGAVVTNDGALADRVRMLANHGRIEKYLHQIPGSNSRLDALQAAVLKVKLGYLDKWNAARRDHASAYLEALADKDVVVPVVHAKAEPVWHLFVIRVGDREGLKDRLSEVGIATQFHYPVPAHLQPAFRADGPGEGSLPITERVASTVISLPMYPELPIGVADLVARTI